jgi:hypothetical protein
MNNDTQKQDTEKKRILKEIERIRQEMEAPLVSLVALEALTTELVRLYRRYTDVVNLA